MSLQTRLESLVAAIGADIKKMVTTDTAQVIAGVKTFPPNTLLMRNAAGTATAEPYSDVNPPETLVMTEFPAGSVPSQTAGTGTIFTADSKTLWMKGDDNIIRPVDMSWEVLPFSVSGTLTVKVGANRFPIAGGTFQIQTVAAMVGTAPTGASVIVDVNKNGSTLFTTQANRPTIAVSTNSATVGTFTATTVTTGDYITVDVDQIGSTVAGSDLTVVIRLQRIA